MARRVLAKGAAWVAAAAASLAAVSPASAGESLPPRLGLEENRVGYSHFLAMIGNDSVWGHQFELSPQWRPFDWLSVSARIHLAEDLEVFGPAKETVNEPEHWSDLLLAVTSPGATIPLVGIQVGGGIHAVLPTSRTSQEATLQAGLGARVDVTRSFPLLAGLALSYSARYLYHFNQYTTGQWCRAIQGTPYCSSTGVRNVESSLAHGPSLRLRPVRSVTLSGAVLWRTSFLYPLSPSPYDEGGRFEVAGLWYSASVEWRAIDPVAVEIGVTDDAFSVLPEAAPISTRLTAVVFVRLTLWPEAALRCW